LAQPVGQTQIELEDIGEMMEPLGLIASYSF